MPSTVDLKIVFHGHCGQFQDRYWTAVEKNGNAHDYGTKDYLIQDAKKRGLTYEVIRTHKDGTQTVMERG